ncbi:MAG: lysine--tRNA ligase [Candidatus Hodarchaeota archaeon]
MVYSHWLEEISQKLIDRKADPVVLNTGKSTSGEFHIGIFRELLICDSLGRLLTKRDTNWDFYLIMDDFDAAKRFPSYIPKEFAKYIGIPFSNIPCPDNDCESYAYHYAMNLINTFDDYGIDPKIIWSSKLYESPEMKDAIRIALKNVELIRKILKKYIAPTLREEEVEDYLIEMEERWPATVICEKCGRLQSEVEGRIQPNRITSFDPATDRVTYTCPACGYEEDTTISKARIKLTWRIDWPAKWFIYCVTCEPAGKDHTVKGGAYDTGLEICQKVYKYEGPVKVEYEWIRFGEADMKTSRGITFTPREFLRICFPEVFRYLILRTHPSRHISFRPELLVQLIDEYDRFERIYYDLEEADEEEKNEAKFLYPLCQIEEVSSEIPKRLPYRFAIIFSQLKNLLTDEKVLEKAIEVVKKSYQISEVTDEVLKTIQMTLQRAENWTKSYGPPEFLLDIPKEITNEIRGSLSDKQREGLRLLAKTLQTEDLDEETLQNRVFTLGKKEVGIGAKKMFQAIYLALIGKKFGPRLAPFLLSLERSWVIERLLDAAD